jgi:hypothetical protein
MNQGNNKEEKNKKVVLVKNNNEDDDKKKKSKRRLIIIIALIVFLVIDVICGIIFIPKIINKLKGNNKENESSYMMDQHTSSRYENLLAYINHARFDSSYSDDMSEITALRYDKPYLYVSYQNDTEPGYIEVEIDDKENIDQVLEIFKDTIPNVGTYSYAIHKEEFNTHKNINISSSLIKGHVSTYVSIDYLSCTYLYDGNTLCSLVNEEYSDEGIYSNITKVTEKEDKLLFDFYYYLLTK